jgi:hypothetical protein
VLQRPDPAQFAYSTGTTSPRRDAAHAEAAAVAAGRDRGREFLQNATKGTKHHRMLAAPFSSRRPRAAVLNSLRQVTQRTPEEAQRSQSVFCLQRLPYRLSDVARNFERPRFAPSVTSVSPSSGLCDTPRTEFRSEPAHWTLVIGHWSFVFRPPGSATPATTQARFAPLGSGHWSLVIPFRHSSFGFRHSGFPHWSFPRASRARHGHG